MLNDHVEMGVPDFSCRLGCYQKKFALECFWATLYRHFIIHKGGHPPNTPKDISPSAFLYTIIGSCSAPLLFLNSSCVMKPIYLIGGMLAVVIIVSL